MDVATRGDLAQVEWAVLATAQRAMVATMQAACRVAEEQATDCPHCGGTDRRREGTDRRILRCVFGRVALALLALPPLDEASEPVKALAEANDYLQRQGMRWKRATAEALAAQPPVLGGTPLTQGLFKVAASRSVSVAVPHSRAGRGPVAGRRPGHQAARGRLIPHRPIAPRTLNRPCSDPDVSR